MIDVNVILAFSGLLIAVVTFLLGVWSSGSRTRSTLIDLRDNHIADVIKRLDRIEQKLDEHIHWHLEQV